MGREDPLEEEEEVATHSCVLGRITPWTEEPGGLQSMGSQRVGYECAPVHAHIYSYSGFRTTELESYFISLEAELNS